MKLKNLSRSVAISLVCIAATFSACTDIDRYDRLVKSELNKGSRVDSLFLGLKFGMTSKEFFASCWEMNKKGVITDGTNNTSVLFKIDTGLAHPVSMNFYPDFQDNKIYKMRVSFQYDGWAPWNKQLFADSLMPRVVNMLQNWYGGNEFIPISDKARGTIYVKVDGNRRITVGKYNDAEIKADFTDLLTEKKIKK